MRFIADENVPAGLVRELGRAGHDVVWVLSQRPGMPDREILAWAVRESRILLTFDKDFGELAWRASLPSSCGVVLFRLPMPAAGSWSALARRQGERNDWGGHFSILESDRVRMRPLAPM